MTAAEVEAELEKIRQEQATWEPADDEPAVDGMLVEADLRGEVVGAEEEPYDEERARFVLGDDGVPTEINAGCRACASARRGSSSSSSPTTTPTPSGPARRCATGFGVTALKRKLLPEVDDELARTVGFDSLDALRERVRRGRSAAEAQRAPANLATRPCSTIWRPGLDVDRAAALAGRPAPARGHQPLRLHHGDAGVWRPNSEQINWQELAAGMEPRSRRRVLDDLVLEQLADAWEIAVPEETVDADHPRAGGTARRPARRSTGPTWPRSTVSRSCAHAARMSATVDELIRRAGGEVEP